MPLPTATREQLQEQARLGALLRRARAATLRSDFHSDDEAEWSRLAEERGVKLPPYGTPCTQGKMEAWLRKLGISRAAYLAWAGERNLGDFPRNNPTWPFKAWVGLVLEHFSRIACGE